MKDNHGHISPTDLSLYSTWNHNNRSITAAIFYYLPPLSHTKHWISFGVCV